MSDTLTLNKLEKLIEVETKLRDEYEQQLEQKDAAIAKLNEDKASLESKLTELEGTVAKQLATITNSRVSPATRKHSSNATGNFTIDQRT